MKKTVALLLTLFCCARLFAQSPADEIIEALYNNGDFETILNDYTEVEGEEYSAASLFYIGCSYMAVENYHTSLEYLTRSIEKNPQRASPYYVRAINYITLYMLDEAVADLEKSIENDTDSVSLSSSYAYLGYVQYARGETDLAFESSAKAIEYDKTSPHPYMYMAEMYKGMQQPEKAVGMYYAAVENISEESEEYQYVLFNIGMIEQYLVNYDAAENAYKTLLGVNPADYHACSNLIQVYYHNREYDSAEPYRKAMYDAYGLGVLEGSYFEDMFCVDQFECAGQNVMAFERYQNDDPGYIYNKLVFYVMDDYGEVDYTIQTEYSPIAAELGSGRYVLCGWSGDTHLNYGLWFDDDSAYENIKSAVVKIMENEVEPAGMLY